MVHHQQLDLVQIGNLVQRLHHRHRVHPVLRAQAVSLDLHVLVRIRRIVQPRLQQIADHPISQKIRHEPIPFPIPSEETRAGGWLHLGLDHQDGLVHRNVREGLQNPARPEHPDHVRLRLLPEPERHRERLRTQVPECPDNRPFLPLGPRLRLDGHPNPIPAAHIPCQPELDPPVPVPPVVHQQRRLKAVVHGQRVHVPIPVEVSERGPSARAAGEVGQTDLGRNVREPSCAVVPENPRTFSVREHEQIQVRIVVQIHEARAPTSAHQPKSQQLHGRPVRLEGPIAPVPIQHVRLVPPSGHEQVRMSIRVIIPDRRAASPGRSRHAGLLSDLLECPVHIVAVQSIWSVIVHHIQIRRPIAIEVEEDRAHAPARAVVEPGLLRHVREGPIAIVPIQ